MQEGSCAIAWRKSAKLGTNEAKWLRGQTSRLVIGPRGREVDLAYLRFGGSAWAENDPRWSGGEKWLSEPLKGAGDDGHSLSSMTSHRLQGPFLYMRISAAMISIGHYS